MVLRAKFLPWKPRVTITGRAFYSVDTVAGIIMSQREEWDALSDNTFLSVPISMLLSFHFVGLHTQHCICHRNIQWEDSLCTKSW